MKNFMLIFAVALLVPAMSFADGCFPGEPCYYAGKKKNKVQAVPAPVAAPVVAEPMTMADPQVFYASLGAGYNFLEKDEEILGHGVFSVALGAYHFTPLLSAQVSFGLMPDIRARENTGGRFMLEDDTEGYQFAADLMFHFDTDAEGAQFDPYAAVGVGVNEYDDDLDEGDSAVFASAGVGTFINLDENWFVKPDYRIMMVGDDTEVNHLLNIAVGYKFCL